MKTAILVSMSLGLGLAMNASPLVFSYTGSPSLGEGTIGNSIVETVSGETVTATAWGVTGGTNGDTTFQTAALGQYAGATFGLGVCNRDEFSNCAPPAHEVDDNGHNEFVLFTFSSPVTSVTITINPVCNCDTDASYFVGNNLSPSGNTLASFGTPINSTGPEMMQRVITLMIPGGGVNSVLFGANTTETYNYFKIGSLSVTPGTATPEPASFALVGVALIGISVLRRKRAQPENR